MPYSELNLAVGKLPPTLDDGSKTALSELIDDLSSFDAS
jgi:hypothetical protein